MSALYFYGLAGVASAARGDLEPLQVAALVLEDLKAKLPLMSAQDVLDALDYEVEENEDADD